MWIKFNKLLQQKKTDEAVLEWERMQLNWNQDIEYLKYIYDKYDDMLNEDEVMRVEENLLTNF
jgi:hypothetical protein